MNLQWKMKIATEDKGRTGIYLLNRQHMLPVSTAFFVVLSTHHETESEETRTDQRRRPLMESQQATGVYQARTNCNNTPTTRENKDVLLKK